MNFDYGNTLRRSFQITWKHKSLWLFSVFPLLLSLVMGFIFVAPVFLLQDNMDDVTEGMAIAVWLAGLVATGIGSIILGTAGSASLTLGIFRIEQGEGSTLFVDLVRDGLPYFWRALGVVLIIQLTVGAVFSIFFLAVFLLTIVTLGFASICLQPVMLLSTPLSFLVIALMDGALTEVITGDLNAWESVKRAFEVVRAHIWKFIILTMIVYFGVSILSGFLAFPAMIPVVVAPLLLESGMNMSGQMVLLILAVFLSIFLPLMLLLSGVTGTFMTSALELAYLRLAQKNGN